MTRRAWLSVRDGPHYRRDVFSSGLRAVGFEVELGRTASPSEGDILVLWNRYGESDRCAGIFEERGLPVLIAENAYLGNSLAGSHWYALARTHHNGAGWWPVGSRDRWDGLQVPLAPFRADGEVVVLPQRGIGPAGVAMPRDWLQRTEERLKGTKYRVRLHPGVRDCIPLEDDLANAGKVITWGSGAALKALTLGIRVESDMPGWIGTQDNTDAGRLSMFRRLAWAQWRLSEIADGSALRALIG